MKCKKCKGTIFWIEEKDCCDNCKYNAAYDEETDEYLWDAKEIEKKGLTRDHVSDEEDCWFGSASGDGCCLITCPGCGHKWNIPLMDN